MLGAARAYVVVLLAALALLGSAPAEAQRTADDRWVLLGSAELDLTQERGTIDVSAAPGRFKSLQLHVKKRGISLRSIAVTLAGGGRQSNDVHMPLLVGEKSAPVPLRNGEQFVRTVVLTYLQVGGEKGPDRISFVEIYGLQSPDGARAVFAPPATAAAPAPAPSAPRPAAPPPPATRGAVPAPSPPPIAMAPSPAPAPPSPPPAAAAPGGSGGASRSAIPSSKSATTESARPTDAQPAENQPYASVPVLFGTDRKQGETRKAKWGGDVDTFGGESQFKLALGKAVVTVPKQGRERGSVARPELIVFGFRVPWGSEQLDKHFTVYSAKRVDEAGFLAEVRDSLAKSKSFEKHAMLFVHGYNVTFEDSLYRTAQIAHDLEFDGAAFMYSWPSKGDPKAYLYDEDRAKGARPFLKEYLELIAEKTGVQHLHIVAHSKGAELLVEVLSALSATPDIAKKLRINEIILAAPDIDRANFEQVAARIVGVAQRGVTLYASNNDKALSLSNTVRLGTVRAGEIPADRGPVLVKGMDTIDISAASTDFFSSNHITFAERQYLISDMRSILANGQHPPDKRSQGIFKPIVLQAGKYWQYVR